MIERRAQLFRALRAFFERRDYLEVDTPVRVSAPPPEPYIDAVEAEDAYLRTSPELHMKRLLAAGHERLFQIGPCFRSGEHGARHRVEFTMLEWYRAGTDYLGLLEETRALLHELARIFPQAHGGLDRALEILTVAEAFRLYAGWNPNEAYDPDRFDEDLVGKVEPALSRDRPVVLKDYPPAVAALSRVRPDRPPVAERWELYLGGLECANAYTELIDPDEQLRRFEAWTRDRAARGRPLYPRDEAFLAALREGLPPCAGIALGMDRLLMALTGTADIADVRPFSD